MAHQQSDAFVGERSCAFVLPREEAPDAAELRAFLRSRGLAAYKIPDLVKVVGEFPVTGVGKISMDEVTRGVWPFMLAQFIVMFAMVFFPQLVLVPARWFY